MRVAFVDFWLEHRSVPLSLSEIKDPGTWSGHRTNRELRHIHEGVGLFHVSHLETILKTKIHVSDPHEADVLICSGFGGLRYYFPHKIKIFLCFESFTIPDPNLPNTFYFSSDLSVTPGFYLPIYVCYHDFELYPFLSSGGERLDEKTFREKKDCLSIISNPGGAFRNEFLARLMEKMSVDNYGRFANNVRNDVVDSSCWYDPRLKTVVERYKFMICMENRSQEGYHTEKIVRGFLHNVIPIYYGDPRCRHIFNPRACIDVNELGAERAIEKILRLAQDLDAYNEMLAEPKIHAESILLTDHEKYTRKDVFEETIRTVFRSARI